MKLKLLTLLIAAGATLALAATPGVAKGPVAKTAATTKHCRRVTVKFGSIGAGGAINIHVRNVGCRKARNVVRHCIKGTVDAGWSASATPDFSRLILQSGNRKIVFTLVGGGGCVPV